MGNSWAYLAYEPRTFFGSVIASCNNIGLSLSFCAIIISLKGAAIWQSRILAPIEFAGVTCYSAYMVHGIFVQYANLRMTDVTRWSHAPFKFLLFVVATFALSAITFTFVEAPGIRHLPQWAFRLRDAPSKFWNIRVNRRK